MSRLWELSRTREVIDGQVEMRASIYDPLLYEEADDQEMEE